MINSFSVEWVFKICQGLFQIQQNGTENNIMIRCVPTVQLEGWVPVMPLKSLCTRTHHSPRGKHSPQMGVYHSHALLYTATKGGTHSTCLTLICIF